MTWEEDVEAALEQLLGWIALPLQALESTNRSGVPVRTPAPAGRSGLHRATGAGRCAVIENAVE